MTSVQQITETLAVPRKHPAYDGHFPGNPIVPGALLLLWLQVRVERWLPDWSLAQASSIKFLAEVKPGDPLTLHATFSDQTGQLSLAVDRSQTLVCKATFLLVAIGAE